MRVEEEWTVLKPEWVWTLGGLLTEHAVVLDSDRIVDVGPAERYPNRGEQLPGRLLLPGLVNAHSHAFQRGFRGHVQDRPAGRDDFWSWRARMYGMANALDAEGIRAVSALAFLEMLEAGITRVGEFHYLHHQPDGRPYDDPDLLARAVLSAAEEVGLGITLLRVAYERGGAGRGVQSDQRRFVDERVTESLEALERLQSMGHDVGLAPHSIRAVSKTGLQALTAWEGIVHAHVSEQPTENDACVAEYGIGPLALFEDVGLLSSKFCAVHLTHPMPDDLDRLIRSSASICVCPSTELDLGDGYLPVDVRLAARLCLGSDSHAQIDLLQECATLEMHARALEGRRNVLTPVGQKHGLASRLLEAATIGGARSLGRPDGGVAIGMPADLFTMDLRRPAACGVPPLEAAALVASASWTDDVWVAGKRVVHEGRHPLRNRVTSSALSAIRGALS